MTVTMSVDSISTRSLLPPACGSGGRRWRVDRRRGGRSSGGRGCTSLICLHDISLVRIQPL